MKTNQLKGGINLNDSRGNPLWLPISPLRRKGRGSHPVLGPGLSQRGQRENVGAIPCGRPGGRFKMFVNNHLLDPTFFRRSIG